MTPRTNASLSALILAILLTAGFAQADVITLTFDDVDEQIACDEIWYEQEIAMSFVTAAANECGSGSCFFGVGIGEVWLYPATLAVDLSNVLGIVSIEIDFIDGCPGPCENAYLFNEGVIIDEAHDFSPMIVYTMGSAVDLLRVNGCEDAITEIRIIGDTLVANETMSWGQIKSRY